MAISGGDTYIVHALAGGHADVVQLDAGDALSSTLRFLGWGEFGVYRIQVSTCCGAGRDGPCQRDAILWRGGCVALVPMKWTVFVLSLP